MRLYFQLPWLPERSAKWVVDYAELHEHWMSAPTVPALYLHGTDDGCATADYAHWVEKILPDGGEVDVVEHAGHFLQLDKPEAVGRRIVDFVGQPR